MAIYIYTVESAFPGTFGISAHQGIRLSEMATRKELKTLRQGVVLELRLPDSTRRQTHLMNYGVSVIRQDDGSFLREEDPFLHFWLSADLPLDAIPAGTEIWWLEDQPGMSDEEVENMLATYKD